MAEPLLIAKGGEEIKIFPEMMNRHGLIAGATGTGKTVTLRVLVESLSKIGVPIFLADVKGDLSGLSTPGGNNPKIEERIKKLNLNNFAYQGYPVIFRDVFGEQGSFVRTTISELGPVLLSRILDLNTTQEGVLSIIFRVADDNALLLLDMKDLRAMATFVAENAADIKTKYGNVSPSSIGAIQRALLTLEDQGADQFFGEPALEIADLIRSENGNGIVNLFAAQRLIQSPRIYATFLLWLLSELFENLPEVGDLEKPKFVFFFDEAHLLFKDVPKALEEKILQIVRLIRSKGVGIFFITQNPSDIPDDILGQLGNKIYHALRATTPNEEKAVKSAARSLRANSSFDTMQALSELGTGEVLISILNREGVPTPVERAFVVPPASRLAPLSSDELKKLVNSSPDAGKYDIRVDRISAYENLAEKAENGPTEQKADVKSQKRRTAEKAEKTDGSTKKSKGKQPVNVAGDIAISVAKTIGTQVTRELVRGILGSLTGPRRR
jgi:DNA helicase HerA-like ATPase